MKWSRMTVRARTKRLRAICARKRNRHLRGSDIATRYFSGITRGGLIVHCWRHDIVLPRVRWPERKKKAKIRAVRR
jgi:hypothetical protein